MSSKWARDQQRKKWEELERNPPPPTERQIDRAAAIEQYEYWLADVDKTLGEGVAVRIVSLMSAWKRLEDFQ